MHSNVHVSQYQNTLNPINWLEDSQIPNIGYLHVNLCTLHVLYIICINYNKYNKKLNGVFAKHNGTHL